MPLIKCPDCGRDVSTLANTCPQCGRPMNPDAPGSRETSSTGRSFADEYDIASAPAGHSQSTTGRSLEDEYALRPSAPASPAAASKQVTPSQAIAIVAVAIFLVILFSMSGDGGRKAGQAPPPRPKYDKFQAQLDCEEFVERQLKAPATADFAPHRELQISGSEAGPWTVRGYVDAQNAFGAKLRSTYVCTIHYQGDRVILDSLDIR